MKALVLSRYGRLGASSRLRMLQYFSEFERNGISSELAALLDDLYLSHLYNDRNTLTRVIIGYKSRIIQMMNSGNANILWIEKELLPWLPWEIERIMLPRHVPFVVDYDDAVFHRYDLHRSALVRRLLGRKIDRVMAGSVLVTAGNSYLAERARAAGASWVEIVPTVVDIDHYVVKSPLESGSRPAIGWIGTPSTWTEYMMPLMPMLRDLASRSDTRLMAVGAGKAADAHPQVEDLPWSEATEVARIQEMDIGIMPLTDTPWARGKCGYKIIQYMACGIPVVASPVGVNADIVEHGVNGFLATTEGEWREALTTLLRDPDLRRTMGAAGRRKIERHYSLQIWGPRVAELLLKAANRHRTI